MYGCHVVPPNDDGADLGVVFFHNEGYSTACGHGTIALVTWALDEGVVERREGENRVVVDVPSGRLETWATRRGRPGALGAVPQRARRSSGRRGSRRRAASSTSPSAGRSTRRLEERVEPGELPRLIALGRELKAAIEAAHDVVHPLEPELRDVYGVIFWQDEGDGPLTQRNVTVFADGEVDRSPCGSGTSARLALLDAQGRLPRGAELRHLSIVGSEFTGRVVGDADVAGRPGRDHRGRGLRLPDGPGRVRARPGRPARRGVPAAVSPARDIACGESTQALVRLRGCPSARASARRAP